MTMRVEALEWPAEGDAVVSFLTVNEWPFHGVPRLSPDAATKVAVVGDDIATFWMLDDAERVGLIRLFDLDDLAVGSPLFDLRIGVSRRHASGYSHPGVRVPTRMTTGTRTGGVALGPGDG